MVKCKLNFGKWVGGEIENGSQRSNNYVVFPRASMIIPAPNLVFFLYFPQDDSNTKKTFGVVDNLTLEV